MQKQKQDKQIRADRDLLATIQEQNDKDLRNAGMAEVVAQQLHVSPDQIGKLAIWNNPDNAKYDEGVDKVSIGTTIKDPDRPGVIIHESVPVLEVHQDGLFNAVDLSADQANLVAAKTQGLKELKEQVMPSLSSNLAQVEDIREGKPYFPPIKG